VKAVAVLRNLQNPDGQKQPAKVKGNPQTDHISTSQTHEERLLVENQKSEKKSKK
jgi:hypothetical protein